MGRLKGVAVVASATPIIYDSFQSATCPYGCEPWPPELAQPFRIVGTTAAGEAFEAWCTSGSLRSLVNWTALRIVETNCSGGPASSPGPMAFRFLIPTEDPLVFTEWGLNQPIGGQPLIPYPVPFAAVLVGP